MNRNLFSPLPRATLCAGAVFLFAVTGCTSNNATTPPQTSDSRATPTAAGFAQFPDIAVPAGAKMNVERSLVLGTRDDWIGRLAMDTAGNPTDAYDFFLREMPKFRWQEITTVRSETSVLTYSRDNRIATIQISKKTLGGSKIDITVSPRGRPAPAAPTDAMPAAPAGAVETAPR